jgi:hypothetical protein
VIGSTRLHQVAAGSVEVLAGVFAAQEVHATSYLHFLLWTTLGNALGGPIFVAIIKYSHAIGVESASPGDGRGDHSQAGDGDRDTMSRDRRR